MIFEVEYNDCSITTYATLEEARAGILDANANGVTPDSIGELDDKGNVVRIYGCTWDVTLEELP